MTKNQKTLLIGAPLLAIIGWVVFEVTQPKLHENGNVHDPCTRCNKLRDEMIRPYVFFTAKDSKKVLISTNNRELSNLDFGSKSYFAELCPVKVTGLGKTIELTFAFDLCDACSICENENRPCDDCDGDDCHDHSTKHNHPFPIDLQIEPTSGVEKSGKLVSPWPHLGDLYSSNNVYGIVEDQITADSSRYLYVINNRRDDLQFRNNLPVTYKVVDKEIEIMGKKVVLPIAFIKPD